MYSRKYREEELKDSIVIDTEGYICGYISGLDVKLGTIVLKLYGYEMKNQDVIDEKELLQRLLDSAPRKGIFSHRLKTEEFYDWIRSSLNLSNEEPVSTEHLLKYASFKNIVIPKKTEDLKVKIEKGSVEWASIDKIAFTGLGKCVILNDSWEAKKRGIVPADTVELINSKDLSGKIVIDSEGKIIGSATKFVAGSPPGILVNLERIKKRKVQNIETSKLTTPEPEKLYQNVINEKEYYQRWSDSEVKRSENQIQNEVIETKEIIKEITINWDRIAKIGDVVFLKETLEALKGDKTLFKKKTTSIAPKKESPPKIVT